MKLTKKDIETPSNYVRECDLTDQLLLRDNDHTPDWLDLKLETYIPIFVYGTLKKGGILHKHIAGFPSLGAGFTVSSTFIMRDVEGKFPSVVDGDPKNKTFSGRVVGEVFMVSPITILELDTAESNGEMFHRRQHWIMLLNQEYRTKTGKSRPSIKSWMYIGDPDFMETVSSSICVIHRESPDSPLLDKYFEWNNDRREGERYSESMRRLWEQNTNYVENTRYAFH